jgi:hypothetical protein
MLAHSQADLPNATVGSVHGSKEKTEHRSDLANDSIYWRLLARPIPLFSMGRPSRREQMQTLQSVAEAPRLHEVSHELKFGDLLPRPVDIALRVALGMRINARCVGQQGRGFDLAEARAE